MTRVGVPYGGQLLFARGIWFLFAAAGLAIFLLGTVGLYLGLNEPCESLEFEAQAVCRQRRASLAGLGLSIETFAALLTAGILVQILPWILVGAVVFWRKFHQLFGIFFSLALILLGTIAIDEALAVWALHDYPALAPLVAAVQFVGISLLAIWYAFPDGRFVPRWTRGLMLLFVVRNFLVIYLPDSPLNPNHLPGPIPELIIAFFVTSVVLSLLYRYARTANISQRQQIKWVVAGASFYSVIYLLRFVPALQSGPVVTLPQLGYVVLLYAGSCLFALCLGISILRFRLFEIDVIVRRTVTYTVVVGLLTVLYFSSVVLLQRIFAGVVGDNSEIITVLSTLGIAALFVPLRNHVQNAIDKRFNRQKYDAQQVLQKFALTVRDETDLDKLTSELVNVVNETMQPKHVRVWLKNTNNAEEKNEFQTNGRIVLRIDDHGVRDGPLRRAAISSAGGQIRRDPGE